MYAFRRIRGCYEFAPHMLATSASLPTPSDPLRGPPEGELPEGQERPPWGAPSTHSVEGEAWVLPHQCFFCGNDVFFFSCSLIC